VLAALELCGRPAHRDDVEVRLASHVSVASVAELVIAVQRGHRGAFAGLYERFHRVVHAIALARVSAAEADDVVQDVFAEAWQKVAQLREPAAFPGWLTALARSRAVDRARSQQRRGVSYSLDDTAPSSRSSVAGHASLSVAPPPRAEAVAALRAIRELPETYRETLIMRLVEELSGPEIAERTGMTPESVRVHLHRGIKLLRERLGGGSDGGSP
jgi:RNA polymerase sigma-70 factor, ECF subfamily